MKISLLDKIDSNTYSEWIDKCYIAARVCYSNKNIEDLLLEVKNKSLTEKEEFLEEKIIKTGHWSVLEHIGFTFVFEDVSRSLTHQLVRHRHLSYSQKSQRYSELKENNFLVVPSEIKKIEYIQTLMDDYTIYINNLKKMFKKMGIKDEDIRFIYPNGTKTTIVVSGNMRSILEVMSKRLCSRAQDEIKHAFKLLKLRLEELLPKNNIFTKYMISKCKICTEKCSDKL